MIALTIILAVLLIALFARKPAGRPAWEDGQDPPVARMTDDEARAGLFGREE